MVGTLEIESNTTYLRSENSNPRHGLFATGYGLEHFSEFVPGLVSSVTVHDWYVLGGFWTWEGDFRTYQGLEGVSVVGRLGEDESSITFCDDSGEQVYEH